MAVTKNFNPNSNENDEAPVSRPENISRKMPSKHAPSVNADQEANTEDNGSENKSTNQLQHGGKEQPQGAIFKMEAWT